MLRKNFAAHTSSLPEADRIFNLADLDQPEQELVEQVKLLLIEEQLQSESAKSTRAARKELRRSLGAKLSDLKVRVSRPGCKGGWTSFLVAVNIPKRTADRYVENYRRAVEPQENLASDQIADTEAVMTKEVSRLTRRLKRTFVTPEARKMFIDQLAIQLLQ